MLNIFKFYKRVKYIDSRSISGKYVGQLRSLLLLVVVVVKQVSIGSLFVVFHRLMLVSYFLLIE